MRFHPFQLAPVLSMILATNSGCSLLSPSDYAGGQGQDGGAPAMPIELTGCDTTDRHLAPGGYYVHGNTICTADGRSHLFHGVDRPSLEWRTDGENLSAADFALMASWKANVVRVALNQDFWLMGSKFYDPTYATRVDSVVAWAEAAGLDVILDLHWSDQGMLGSCSPSKGCQQFMADINSKTFWTEVATRYKGDGRVLFELYNEPHDVPWTTWQKGGTTGSGWEVVGMQQLYDAVRAAGADNLVIVGGLNWAFDLSGVATNRIAGYNIMYATHPYDSPDRSPGRWNAAWGYLTKTDPVIVTEFGDLGGTCATEYSAQLIAYADLHAASWTAWAWYPGGCTFPAIIEAWDGTPSAVGMVVKAALAKYHDPAPGGAGDGGPPASEDGGTAATDGGGAD